MPYTWTTGETITAAKLNALETEAFTGIKKIYQNTSTSQSTTFSTTFVDGAASVTFTASGTSAYVFASSGSVYAQETTVAYSAIIAVNINSTDRVIASHGYVTVPGSGGLPTEGNTVAGGILVTGLTKGSSYTAKIRFRSTSGFVVHLNSGGTSVQQITVFDIG